MSVISVSSAAQLMNAVKKAVNGDVITLKAGNYSGVNLDNIQKSGNVTIQSADPLHRAVLTDLKVNASSGLTFSGLEFVATKDLPFQVLSSSRINLNDLYVHGTLNGSSHDDVRGLIIRGSTDVTLTNSRFTELTDAVSHLDSNKLTVQGNSFNLIRDNGIAGGGTSNLTIKGNYFTNFDHVGDIHPDAIQVWTTNTKASATDIVIDGNVFDRGQGAAIQGIWMRDEVGNLPFQRVTITNNTIVGAVYNGIGVWGANDLTIASNTVIAMADQQSWISVQGSTNVKVTGNLASDFALTGTDIQQSGNVKAGTVADTALNALGTWLSEQSLTADRSTLSGQFSAAVLAKTALTGYIDAPVKGAASYVFTEITTKGTAGADRLTVGKIGQYRLDGGAGDDTLTGGGTGNHTLVGGTGNDTYVLYNAGEVVVEQAGGGTDTVVAHIDYALTANVENIRAGAGDLAIHGNDLDNTISGLAGTNWLYGEGGNDTIQGGTGDDTIYGGTGADRLIGQDGNDTLFGGEGNDTLTGGLGKDVIDGGAGNDTIEGGVGADTLTGGAGTDIFVFRTTDFVANVASIDRILDFSRVEGDRISLSAIDAKVGTTADDAFTFIGSDAFHHKAGELRYEAGDGGAYVMGDTNGDGVADFKIFVAQVPSLVQSDFWL